MKLQQNVDIQALDNSIMQGPSAFTAAQIRLEEFIDLEQFPIHDIGNPKRTELVDHCREGLQSVGCSHVPNFIKASAVTEMAREAMRLKTLAWHTQEQMNPYFLADDPSLPKSHPKRFFQSRTSAFINSDLLEVDSLLRKVYDSDVMLNFFCDCLDVGPIYRWADPLGRNPYSVMTDGDYFPWHFDGNDFTVSILVQQADQGGDFEYCPNIRSPKNENFDQVRSVLKGNTEPVKVLALKTGDLQLFKGRYSMHRVTQVQGEIERIIALPTYVKDPYLMNRPHHSKVLYGRYLPIHVEREMSRADGLSD